MIIPADWPAPAGLIAFTTTRIGGQSRAPFDSLNLGHHVGDSAADVAANRAVLQRHLGAGTQVQWLNQVHGTTVVAARDHGLPEADAAISTDPDIACAVLTADCLPVLFCDRGATCVAAAHAGWRGLQAGVLEATVAAMPCAPGDLLAWFGPAIGPAAFEVGAEVREAFYNSAALSQREETASCFTPSSREGHFLADIYQLARLRLESVGVSAISGGGLCTFSDEARFYSYRRDGKTGRMASVVCFA
ncbi:peptidoglycan editing factor PgeF [Parahaliea mediterranea]|uniref:peptidoglycan editing factor PgeF n=1 Tax=Parahaliea mediterranea TaxID=651086 RepID=UPI001F4E8B75|nr:peptidoglycan editing factor PgeF [Parahaliea mediterranea]